MGGSICRLLPTFIPGQAMKPILALTLALCTAMVCACSPNPSSEQPKVSPLEAPVQINTKPLPTKPVDLAGLEDVSVDDLVKRHREAISDGRLEAPAGNNAIEYELALRHRLESEAPGGYQRMLDDMGPRLVLLAEHAVARGEMGERDRLVDLLEAIDPSLPAIGRLRQAKTAQDVGYGAIIAVPEQAMDAADELMEPEVPGAPAR